MKVYRDNSCKGLLYTLSWEAAVHLKVNQEMMMMMTDQIEFFL